MPIVPHGDESLNAQISQTEDEAVLRIGFYVGIDSLNPMVGLTDASYTFYGLVYDALQGAGNDLEATPNLATESWIVPESDPELVMSGEPFGSVWQYNITENAKWHDGTPFTPEDVEWNINLNSQYYETMWAFQPYTYFISYAELYESHAVRIHFAERLTAEPIPVSFGGFLPIYMLPMHKLSGVMSPFDIAFTWTGTFEEDPPIVGTGPFMAGPDLYDEYLSGSVINLYKNPDHHLLPDQGLEVSVDRIEMHFYDDPDEMSLALQAGELDVAKLPADQYSELEGLVEDGLVENITLFGGPTCYGHWTDVGFNMYEGGPNMARLDPAVRQALAIATNKTHIVEEMYQGYADEGSTLVAPVHEAWHYEPAVDELFPYDPGLANATLDAAGYLYPYEGAAVRVATADSLAVQMGWVVENTVLSFEMLVRQEFPEEVQISQYLAEAWAEVGVWVDVDVVTEATLSTIVYSYQYDTCIWYWYSEPDPNYILFCQSERSWGAWSDNMYYTPEYEASYIMSVTELDPVLRKQYVDECQLINYQDAPYIVLAYTYQTYAWRTDTFDGWGDWAGDPGRSLDAYWTVNPLFFDLNSVDVNQPPAMLSIGLPTGYIFTDCVTEVVVSVDDSDGDDLLIALDFGDGTVVQQTAEGPATHHEVVFTHVYNLPDVYELSTWADDLSGIEGHNISYGPVAMTVLEYNAPPQNVTLELPDGDVYNGQLVEFLASVYDVDGDDLLVEVDFGDGMAEGFFTEGTSTYLELTFVHSYDLAGDYDVSVMVDDQTGYPGHVVRYGPVVFTVLDDDIPPVTEADISGDGSISTWFVSDVTVTLAASDVGGVVESIGYSLESGAWTEYTGALVISEEGETSLSYRATDSNGNVELVQMVVIRIDTVAPTVSLEVDAKQTSSDVTVMVTWADEASGVVRMTASLDGAAASEKDLTATLFLEGLEDGEHTLVVTVYDDAGHMSSDTVTFDVETSVFALDGPVGPWAVIGVVLGILAAVGVGSILMYRWMKKPGA